MSSPSETQGTSADSGHTDTANGVSGPLFSSYLDHRRYLIQSEQDAAKSYDRWLLTLSGGALGLSMAFARDIAIPGGVVYAPLLLAAWLAFSTAVALGFWCIQVSQRAHEDSRVLLDATMDEFVKDRREAGFWSAVNEKDKQSPRSDCVDQLNCWSAYAFVTGIVLLSVFACLNVPLRSSGIMPVDPKEIAEEVTDQQHQTPSGDDGVDQLIPCSAPPCSSPVKEERAMKPAPGPVDQAPAPKPPAEHK